MVRPLSYYKSLIAKAQTVEELHRIDYEAFRDDDECTAFSKKTHKITAMCIKREDELKGERMTEGQYKELDKLLSVFVEDAKKEGHYAG